MMISFILQPGMVKSRNWATPSAEREVYWEVKLLLVGVEGREQQPSGKASRKASRFCVIVIRAGGRGIGVVFKLTLSIPLARN